MRNTPTVVAALGPTNTGKTHRALARMLEYDSGMIGLPLRLLAREVYDRLTTQVGEEAVALVTGEERRVPERPAYWVCTVEAMPTRVQVQFLAIDEVQLAAHPQRGHVFTERVLRARGTRETWFLGAATMGPLLGHFAHAGSTERFRRFSVLRHAGHHSLRGLPPRSAIVAFSARDVYELAARLHRLRGGVAVVLGSLSPRTRNAQVAMYQAGEVQYMVATDAIGMGLNLDLDHVCFAALDKFDGRTQRPLWDSELGQIAGRAGRHLSDGSFSTLKPLALRTQVADAIESHRFQTLQKLYYRNAELDYSSLDALERSLTAAPPDPALVRVPYADDLEALRCLKERSDAHALALDEAGVRTLWEVCQVPNFRKLLPEHHAADLQPIFEQLRRRGELDAAAFDRAVRKLDRTDGDIVALTDRLERIRTYSYLSHRGGWLPDQEQRREHTRAVEDRLGDALHAGLVARFVSSDAGASRRRGQQPATGPGEGTAADGPFAGLAALRQQMAKKEGQAGEVEGAFVARLEAARHPDFTVNDQGTIWFESERLARLVPGKEVRRPGVALFEPETWTAGARTRVLRRLLALGQDLVAEADGGLRGLRQTVQSPQGRGLLYALEQAFGILPRSEYTRLFRGLPSSDGIRLKRAGLVRGAFTAYVPDALKGPALARRALLLGLHERQTLPRHGPLLVGHRFENRAQATRFGYLSLLPEAAIRFDLLERLAAEALAGNLDTLSDMVSGMGLNRATEARLLDRLHLERNADLAITAKPRRARGRRSQRRTPTKANLAPSKDG